MEIRRYEPRDLPALYRICLATGHAGSDATTLFRNPLLVGHVYAAPYALHSPECCLVAEDNCGVAGYIVGALDTRAFDTRLEAEWWPLLRRALPAPPRDAGMTADALMLRLIHRPFHAPDHVAQSHPSHLHINLLPRGQGKGMGKRMLDAWLDVMRTLGSAGVHLATGTANARAERFYRRYGFRELERGGRDGSIIWFGLDLT